MDERLLMYNGVLDEEKEREREREREVERQNQEWYAQRWVLIRMRYLP